MDRSQCSRLISLYAAHKCLWNHNDPKFAQKSARDKAWWRISRQMGNIPLTVLRRKMRSLAGGYRRERYRERHSRAAGSGAKEPYKSRWFAYKDFAFLAHKNDAGTSKDVTQGETSNQSDTEEQQIEEPEYLEIHNDNLTDEITIKEEMVSSNIMYRDESPTSTPPKKKVVSRKVSRPVHGSLKRTMMRPKTIHNYVTEESHPKYHKKLELLRKKDECDSFGEYIATSLRKHDDRTRSMIKHAINNILFEQEMKKYGGGSGYYNVEGEDGEDTNPLILEN